MRIVMVIAIGWLLYIVVMTVGLREYAIRKNEPQAEITALKAQVRLLEDQLIDARAEKYKPGCTLPHIE